MKSSLTSALSGRLGRGAFWLRNFVAIPVLLYLESALATLPGRPVDLVPCAALVAYLVSVWVRRLHDRNRSGWWLLVFAVPVLGAVFLFIECGLRGAREKGQRYGENAGVAGAYLTVNGT